MVHVKHDMKHRIAEANAQEEIKDGPVEPNESLHDPPLVPPNTKDGQNELESSLDYIRKIEEATAADLKEVREELLESTRHAKTAQGIAQSQSQSYYLRDKAQTGH